MIVRESMFDSLLLACPSFQECWQEFVSDWEDEPEVEEDGFPYYLALGQLAHHLTEKLSMNETSEFGEVFGVVERWHVEGDKYVREAATVGLLEGLQGCASDNQKRAILETWLLPESKKWWMQLNEFWNGDSKTLRE